MNDKTDLLQNLRLDRSPKTARRSSWLWPSLLAVVVLSLAGVGGFLVLRGGDDIPVTTAVARSAESPAASSLDASGYVVARRQATVAAKITARVTEIMIEEGQHVTGGQIMARLDDSNIRAALMQAQAQVAQADASLAAVRQALVDETPIFRRLQDLNGKGWVSGADFDVERAKYNAAQQSILVSERSLALARAGLQVAERNEEDTVVRAPYDGVVTVKAAQPGEVVSPLSAGGGFTRTGIGTLVDMDSLEVEVDVSENFIDRARPGQDVTVRLNAYPDWQIPASVIAIIPTADRSKATVKVRVGFKQKDPRILPEMGARVAFLAKPAAEATATPGIVVPAAAVSYDGERGTVFLLQGDKVEPRAVTLGARQGRDQTIIQGLSGGETLAIGDFARLAKRGKIVRRDSH